MLLTLAPGFAPGVSAADGGYTITVSPSENGTVTADKSAATEGETITLTVAPDEMYKLESLVVNQTDVTTSVVDGKYAFEMPAEAVTVTASFKALELFGIILDKSRFVLPFGTEVDETLLRGLVGEIIAVYDHYDGPGIRRSDYELYNIDTDARVTTIKYINKVVQIWWNYGYPLTIDESIEHGNVTVEDSMASEGSSVKLTIVPDDGYKLDSITVMHGETPVYVYKKPNPYFMMPDGSVTISATFKKSIARYGVWIGDEEFTENTLAIEGDKGTATFDPETNTLTLDNFEYTGCDIETDVLNFEENLHFSDAGEISEHAISAMNRAVGKGLRKGKTESTVNPKDNATRAEMAAILHRFIEATK